MPFLTEEPTIAEIDDLDVHSESTMSMSTAMSTVGSQIPSTVGTFAGSTASIKAQPWRKVLTGQWLKSQSQIGTSGESSGKSRRTSATEPPRIPEVEASRFAESNSVKTDFLSVSYTSQVSALGGTAPPQVEQNAANLENIPRVVPKWKCFIKSFTATHIMLCFVPASFDDLRILVQGHSIVQLTQEATTDQEQSRDREQSSPPFISVDGVEFARKVRKVHVSGNKAQGSQFSENNQPGSGTSEQELSSSQEHLTEGCDETRDPHLNLPDLERPPVNEQPEAIPADMPEPEAAIANEALPDNYKAFAIPVYIYNCPLNSLTDQLVNKWTYKSPSDIYQDLTFSSESEDKTQEDKEETKKEVSWEYRSLYLTICGTFLPLFTQCII